MSTPVFTVKILWHSEHLPEWELDTTHTGFPTPIQAALYANTIGISGPSLLRLANGRVSISMSFGGEIAADDASLATTSGPFPRLTSLQVWKLRPDIQHGEAVFDADFEELQFAKLAELSTIGLDGEWLPVGYDVIGPSGRISVTVEERDSQLRLAVERTDPDEDHDNATLLTLIPKA